MQIKTDIGSYPNFVLILMARLRIAITGNPFTMSS